MKAPTENPCPTASEEVSKFAESLENLRFRQARLEGFLGSTGCWRRQKFKV